MGSYVTGSLTATERKSEDRKCYEVERLSYIEVGMSVNYPR